jgi:hypothetical protein
LPGTAPLFFLHLAEDLAGADLGAQADHLTLGGRLPGFLLLRNRGPHARPPDFCGATRECTALLLAHQGDARTAARPPCFPSFKQRARQKPRTQVEADWHVDRTGPAWPRLVR